MSFVCHEFGPEGVAYLREYLDANDGFGKRLGRLLLNTRAFEAGTTSAFVPSESSLQQRVNFHHGGLFPGAGRGEPYRRSAVEAFEIWLRDLMGSPGSPPRLLCVEDSLGRRSDAMLDQPSERTLFFCGDAAYWYATRPEGVAKIPIGGATWTPDIAIVTTLPKGMSDIRNEQSLEPEALRDMADDAVAVIVGAWDAEGLLIWTPAGGVTPSTGTRRLVEVK